ncbi:MAG TPA: hypothetical protein VGG06_12620 [Thermoanaerobaculia bacterium]|jgi:hypothetical protein
MRRATVLSVLSVCLLLSSSVALAVEPGVELDNGDLLVLNLIATSVEPLGEPETLIWENEAGDTLQVSTQLVNLTLFNGQTLAAKVECSHSGCDGPVCIVKGCVPDGTDCTPAECKKKHAPSENCSGTPRCSKKVTSQ